MTFEATIKSITRKTDRNFATEAYLAGLALLATETADEGVLVELRTLTRRMKAVLKLHREEGYLSWENGVERRAIYERMIELSRAILPQVKADEFYGAF